MNVAGIQQNVNGYDGLITSGVFMARGIIQQTSGTNFNFYDAAYYSVANEFFLVGGEDIGNAKTYNYVWKSIDGLNYFIIDVAAPFSARRGAKMVGYGNSVYLVGGKDASGNDLREIWSGSVNLTAQTITWNPTPIMTSSMLITGSTVLTYNSSSNQIYTSKGILNLNTMSESLQTFGTANHKSGTMYYDPKRWVLWASDRGNRAESIVDLTGGIYEQDVIKPYFASQQFTASTTTFNFSHSLPNANCALFMNQNYNYIGPANSSVVGNTVSASFNTSYQGFGFALSGTLFNASTTWFVTVPHSGCAWMIISRECPNGANKRSVWNKHIFDPIVQ